ncbi:ABC transporter permease [Clostridium tyrobutyricum]|uniref:ABC transporter permease n=1 Tax=Clostridium tyrobutyricum TaxID=1519 RepID=UPI001C388A5A|nr:ABC transporter permease [Clostridium tyrobutyricum]MBV4439769.1 ABC transporter permease [Clostridium tyrobutyricum]
MMNVISSEFYKIFKSKVFYAVSIIFLAMNVISFATSIPIKKSASTSIELKTNMLGTGFSNYQESYSVDAIFYIILIFVAYLITSEYANGSIRQMACHGIARWKLVVGQYIAISCVITIILLGFGILNLLLITTLSELGRVDAAAFIRMNVGIICMFWGITGIGTFLSYLLKNVGITIIVSILLVASKDFIVNLFALLTKNEVFKTYTLTNMRNTIINFNSKPEDVVKYSIVFLIIGVVTILASSLLFSKRDIK